MNDSQKKEKRVETGMTADQLMKLVTRYTEACDDMGAGLFEQTAEQTAAKHKAATDLWKQIGAEVDRLHREAAKSERRAITFGDIVHSQVLAMRAAVVAAKLDGLEVGMQWIANTLEGPGQLPDLDEARALGGAQALWDKETAEHIAFRAAHPGPAAPVSGRFHSAPDQTIDHDSTH